MKMNCDAQRLVSNKKIWTSDVPLSYPCRFLVVRHLVVWHDSTVPLSTPQEHALIVHVLAPVLVFTYAIHSPHPPLRRLVWANNLWIPRSDVTVLAAPRHVFGEIIQDNHGIHGEK